MDAEKVKGGVCWYDPVSAFRTGFWPGQREFHELSNVSAAAGQAQYIRRRVMVDVN